MKLRKRKLFSSIAFVLSLVMLAVSGAVFVHTATQQSTTSTLQVTYDARNVNFSADAWYEKPSNNARQAFTGNTLSVSATAAESSSHTLSVGSEITLDATTDTYILFTYKFVNTASSDGYDMLVALTDNATKTNVKVKYYTSVISDTNPSMYSTLSSQKDTVENGGSSSVPADVCVPAQSTLYYYVLVEIDDNTIGSSYTGDNDHKIIWTITSANTKNATMYSVCFDANGGSGSMTSQSYTSGTQQALTTNTLTKEGYTFAGWSTTPNGSVVYTDEQTLTLTSQSNGTQIVLYAVWEEADLVSITFDYAGRSISTALVIFDDGIAVFKATGSGDEDGRETFYVERNSVIDVCHGSDYVNVEIGDNINNSNAISGINPQATTYIFALNGAKKPNDFSFTASGDSYTITLLYYI